MKRISTLLSAFACALAMQAQTTPAITFTAEVDGKERSFGLSTIENSKISIDWGDGILVEDSVYVYDGWDATTIRGIVKGDGTVKIYGEGFTDFDGGYVAADSVSKISAVDITGATELIRLSLNTNELTKLDVSKNTKLEKLLINGNKLENIDLTANTALTEINLVDNKLTTIDLSTNKSLATLRLNNNLLAGELDFSANTELKSVYILNNLIESIIFGEITADNVYISLNNNANLSKVDVSKAVGFAGKKAKLFLTGCNISSAEDLKLPAEVYTMNVSKNKFTFATLPTTAKITNYTYFPQAELSVNDLLSEAGVLDLSAQNNIVGLATEAQATTYTVYAGETALVEGTDYTIANGVITFLKSQEGAYVTMESAAWPKFTKTNIFKTETFNVTVVTTGIESVVAGNEAVRYFTISGMPLNSKPVTRGMFIESVNGKSRVVVK